MLLFELFPALVMVASLFIGIALYIRNRNLSD